MGQNYSIAKATITIGTGETTNSKGYSSGTENGISGVYFNGGEFIRSVTFSGFQNGEKINLSWKIESSLYKGQSIGTLGQEFFLTCIPTMGDNSFSFTVRNAGQYSVTIALADGEEADGKQFLANNYKLSGNATLTLNVLRETLTISSNDTTVEYGSPLSDADRFDGFKPTYTLPDIKLEETRGTIGKYGMMRKEYLRNHKKARVSILALQNMLDSHLMEVDSEARQKVEDLTMQLLEKDPAPEKSADSMAWTRHMNRIRAQAEEMVVQEIIYN